MFSGVLKIVQRGKYIRNLLTVLKYGSREGWRRSAGQFAWEMKKCYPT